MPVDPRYIAWCEHCGWNLKPYQPAQPRAMLSTLYANLGDRLGRSMFEQLVGAPSLAPALTLPIVLAVVLAAMIHASTLVSLLFGLWLIAAHWFNLFAILGGMLLIWLAWVLRPRLPRFPEHPLPPTEYPGLYGLTDLVVQALEAPPIAAIVITPDFNAAYSFAGWRRRPVLRLGLPLLTVLDDRETVALIGHEVAHAVNGDATSGFFVGSAINTLAIWYTLLYPDRLMLHTQYRRSIITVFTNLILVCLAGLIGFIASGLTHLLWRDAQRAEYLADHLAAEVAGTEATLSMLDKLHLGPMASGAAQRLAVSTAAGDLFAELRDLAGAMPEHERRRLRAMARLEASRLDASHPPTSFRVALLEQRPIAMPAVHVPGTLWRVAQDEMNRLAPPMQRRILDLYRARLYR
jgi:Zn-dependent protease with chaperone function